MSLSNNSTLLNNILTKANNLPNISSDYTKLNFKVVGGTTQPSNPTENMIWVNTPTPITGWVISPMEPINPAPNSVWISVGSIGEIGFSAIINNNIQLFPLFVEQYISGEWTGKTTMCYHANNWIKLWDGYLFNNGEIPHFITGWRTNGGASGALTFNVGNAITATASEYGATYFYPLPAIDLTLYNKFIVDMNIDRYESGWDSFICVSKAGDTTFEAKTLTNGTGRQTIEIDISAFEGTYYCGAYIKSWRGAKTTANIYSMRLVK